MSLPTILPEHRLISHRQSRNVGNRHVVIHSQKDSAFNVMDPVKYVLILALRFGVGRIHDHRGPRCQHSIATRQDYTVDQTKISCPSCI